MKTIDLENELNNSRNEREAKFPVVRNTETR